MSVSTISGQYNGMRVAELFEECMKGHVTVELVRLVGDVLGTEAGTALELCAKYGKVATKLYYMLLEHGCLKTRDIPMTPNNKYKAIRQLATIGLVKRRRGWIYLAVENRERDQGNISRAR